MRWTQQRQNRILSVGKKRAQAWSKDWSSTPPLTVRAVLLPGSEGDLGCGKDKKGEDFGRICLRLLGRIGAHVNTRNKGKHEEV